VVVGVEQIEPCREFGVIQPRVWKSVVKRPVMGEEASRRWWVAPGFGFGRGNVRVAVMKIVESIIVTSEISGVCAAGRCVWELRGTAACAGSGAGSPLLHARVDAPPVSVFGLASS
jgi:hypothetical protein